MTLISEPSDLLFTIIGFAAYWLFSVLNDMRKESLNKRREQVDAIANKDKEIALLRKKVRKLEESLHYHRVKMTQSGVFDPLPPYLPED